MYPCIACPTRGVYMHMHVHVVLDMYMFTLQAIDGWSKGTHEGKTGLFPNNFLFQPANITPPPLPSRSHPPTPSPPSPSPPPLPTKHGTASTVSFLPSSAPPQDLPVEIARAAFEYVADNVDELTIQVMNAGIN